MPQAKDFNYSYWELKHYFTRYDLVIIGGGIVGLSTAISFSEKNKKARIMILERGVLPNGASTKNAGFACFGSAGELLHDLDVNDPATVWETVNMRYQGLQMLKKRIGEKNMDYQALGGYELFNDAAGFEKCLQSLPALNQAMLGYIGLRNCYTNASRQMNGFGNTHGVIRNRHEAQIDTGLMMDALFQLAVQNGIRIINNVTVNSIDDLDQKVALHTSAGVFEANRVVVATNGFARSLLKIKDVHPARAQVLITKPIPGLKIRGSFHFDEGFYYFRNIDNRILFGGGRNLDLKTEQTVVNGLHPMIQKTLAKYLKTIILPGVPHQIDHRWSGIMGIGNEKKPIIRFVGKNLLVAVRMGGMGIAIGSLVGSEAAEKLNQ